MSRSISVVEPSVRRPLSRSSCFCQFMIVFRETLHSPATALACGPDWTMSRVLHRNSGRYVGRFPMLESFSVRTKVCTQSGQLQPVYDFVTALKFVRAILDRFLEEAKHALSPILIGTNAKSVSSISATRESARTVKNPSPSLGHLSFTWSYLFTFWS